MKWRVGVMGMGGGMHLKQIRRYMVRDERWISRAGREVQDAIQNLRLSLNPMKSALILSNEMCNGYVEMKS